MKYQRKTVFFFNMSSYCEKHHLDVWNYVPLTITLDMNDSEFEYDIHKFGRIFKSVEAYNNPRVLEALNCRRLDEKHIKTYNRHNDTPCHKEIIKEIDEGYDEDPLNKSE